MLADSNRRFHFYHWFSVSLILHSGILLPFVLFSLHTPAQHRGSKLQIELFGMIANRQTEAKIQRQAPPPPRQPPIVRKPRQAPPKHKTYKTVTAKSPVQVHSDKKKPKSVERKDKPKPAEREDKPKPANQTIQPIQAQAVPSSDAVPGTARSGNSNVQQRQQTIGTFAGQRLDINRRYIARLAKQLRSNLAYPEEVRKYGIDGISTVTFVVTKSGDIKSDSLKIKRSSGYPALDNSALMSARTSAPFEKPPKELTVSIAVEFSISMANAHRKQTSES